MIIRTRPLVIAAVLILTLDSVPLARQASTSPPAVKQLTQVLDAAKLDAIAAADPSEPGRFVAALDLAVLQAHARLPERAPVIALSPPVQ